MPVNHTNSKYYPEKNFQVVKYMDLTKFVSLLQRESLFFCRLDKLEDHFEGTTEKVNWQEQYNFFSRQHLLSPNFPELTDEEIVEKTKSYFDLERKRKELFTVCCWNISNKESAALWKIYSNFNQGLMITSKVSSIIESFKNTAEEINVSRVKYIDYQNERIQRGNIIYPVLHKHIAYSYENELRLIHKVSSKKGQTYNWKKEEIEQGKYVKVDLNMMIDEIVLSPFAPSWYLDLVKNLCETYQLKTTIMKSELAKE